MRGDDRFLMNTRKWVFSLIEILLYLYLPPVEFGMYVMYCTSTCTLRAVEGIRIWSWAPGMARESRESIDRNGYVEIVSDAGFFF